MLENQKHKMTVKSIVVCIIIAFFIVIVGNTIYYLVNQAFQPPDVDAVLVKLQQDGFTDSYIYVDEKYSTRSIYVLDDAVHVYGVGDNAFRIYVEKDVNYEDMKNVLLSVMRVFDKDFSLYDAKKILNLNEDDSDIRINNILYWTMFKDGKLYCISVVL